MTHRANPLQNQSVRTMSMSFQTKAKKVPKQINNKIAACNNSVGSDWNFPRYLYTKWCKQSDSPKQEHASSVSLVPRANQHRTPLEEKNKKSKTHLENP